MYKLHKKQNMKRNLQLFSDFETHTVNVNVRKVRYAVSSFVNCIELKVARIRVKYHYEH